MKNQKYRSYWLILTLGLCITVNATAADTWASAEKQSVDSETIGESADKKTEAEKSVNERPAGEESEAEKSVNERSVDEESEAERSADRKFVNEKRWTP